MGCSGLVHTCKSVIALSEGKGQIGFCAWKEIRLSPFRCYPGPAWSEGQPSQGYAAVCVSLPCSVLRKAAAAHRIQDSLSLRVNYCLAGKSSQTAAILRAGR